MYSFTSYFLKVSFIIFSYMCWVSPSHVLHLVFLTKISSLIRLYWHAVPVV